MNRQPLTVVEVDLEQLGKSVFEGEEFIPASPLAHWIARLGGYSGELPDPYLLVRFPNPFWVVVSAASAVGDFFFRGDSDAAQPSAGTTVTGTTTTTTALAAQRRQAPNVLRLQIQYGNHTESRVLTSYDAGGVTVEEAVKALLVSL